MPRRKDHQEILCCLWQHKAGTTSWQKGRRCSQPLPLLADFRRGALHCCSCYGLWRSPCCRVSEPMSQSGSITAHTFSTWKTQAGSREGHGGSGWPEQYSAFPVLRASPSGFLPAALRRQCWLCFLSLGPSTTSHHSTQALAQHLGCLPASCPPYQAKQGLTVPGKLPKDQLLNN